MTPTPRSGRAGDSAKPPILVSHSGPWAQISEVAEALAVHGLPGAADRAMLNDTGLVPRILSIQLNRGVGYVVGTRYLVLNAIMQNGADN